MMRVILLMIAILFSAQSVSASPALDVKSRVLKNGLTVLHVERENLPMVQITLLIKAGATRDTARLSGLASLTASLLTEGTRSRSSEQISQEVEFLGASLSASASDDFSTLRLSVLKKDLDTGFSILSDVLLNATFPNMEIKRKKDQTKGALRQRREDPQHVASLRFDELVYGDHPYGRQVSGDEQSIDHIARKDIKRYYTTYYVPNNAVLSVVGMISPEELDALLSKYLSGWTPSEVPTLSLPTPANAKAGLYTIDRELTQATILLGHLGVERSHPDYYALQVMNYILGGGGFSSRMMDRLRDQMGLTYGVYSRFNSSLESGSFMVSIQTRNSSAFTAINEIKALINAMIGEGVTPEELSDAKAYLTGSFPRRIDTMNEISSFLAMVEFYGLGLDYPGKYAQRINAVTRDDVLRVARTHMRARDLITVVVGKLSETDGLDGSPAP